MSKSIRDRLIAARESWIQAGGFEFKVRRPTEMQTLAWRALDRDQVAESMIKTCVVGWRGVRECDLASGESDDEAVFDALTFAAWIEDRPDLWEPITGAVLASIEAARSSREASEKN